MFAPLILAALVQSGAARLDPYGDPLPPGCLARVGSLRSAEDSLHFAALALDGKTCVVGGMYGEKRLTIRDAVTQKARRVIALAANTETWAVGISADGRRVAAVLSRTPKPGDLFVMHALVWDAETGKTLADVGMGHRQGTGEAVAFSPDGKTLAAFSGFPHVIDVEANKLVRSFGTVLDGRIDRLAFVSGDRHLFATGPQNFHLWDVKEGSAVAHDDLKLPNGIVWGQKTLSADGKFLVSAGVNWCARSPVVWPEKAGDPVRFGAAIVVSSTDAKQKLWAAPDGSAALCWTSSTGLQLCDFAAKKVTATVPWHGGKVFDAAFPPSGPLALRRGADQYQERFTELIDVVSAKSLTRAAGVRFAKGETEWRDAKTLRVGSDLWDAATGRHLGEEMGPPRPTGPGWLAPDDRRFVVSGDGRTALVEVGGEPRTINIGGGVRIIPALDASVAGTEVWDVRTNRKVGAFRTGGGGAPMLQGPNGITLLSGDGRVAAARPKSDLARFDIWDTSSGRKRFTIDAEGALGQGWGWRMTPDGRRLAASGEKGVAVFDLRTGGRQIVPHPSTPGDATNIDVSADGRLVAVGSYPSGRLAVFDMASRRRLFARATGQAGLNQMRLSPDGSKVATVGAGGWWHVWAMPPLEPPALPFAVGDLEAAWKRLGSADAATLDRWAGPEAVRFLGDRLNPASEPDPLPVLDAVRRLGSEKFAEREAAEADLVGMGEKAIPALRRALLKADDPEVVRLVEAIVERGEGPALTPEVARQLVAVEILERIGTPEARHHLKRLAEGADGDPLTAEARAAGRR